MPRLPRFFVPGLPLHAIQRGNDRAAIFRGPDDFAFYRECLAHAARRYGLLVHAYVLMTNHVHLLASPLTPASMPKAMQSIGRVYVKYFNARYGRTGTLWEGRYRAAIVDRDAYLLACMRYIELNPVRASMALDASAYRWSSFAANALGAIDELVSPHPVLEALGRSPAARRATYRALFDLPIGEIELAAIRDATHNGWALGGKRFQDRISRLGRRAQRAAIGRPRKPAEAAAQNSTLTLVSDETPL